MAINLTRLSERTWTFLHVLTWVMGYTLPCVRCMTPLWLWCMSVISNDDWMTRVNTWKTWTPHLREAIKASDRGHSVHRSTISPSHCAPLYFLCVCVCVCVCCQACSCACVWAHTLIQQRHVGCLVAQDLLASWEDSGVTQPLIGWPQRFFPSRCRARCPPPIPSSFPPSLPPS